MKNNFPFVSVIIPTVARAEALRATLTDVLAQEYAAFEIIIVDQSANPARDLDARVQVIATQPAHLTRARNIGIRAARGEILLFIDDDVALPAHFIHAHARVYADARVGGVAGRVIIDSKPSRPLRAPRATQTDFDRDQRAVVPFARGCNMSFRRDVLMHAGMFDENFSAAGYSEEEDISFAIRARGYQIIFEPDAWLYHRQTKSGGTRADPRAPAERIAFYHDKIYFALKNVGGLDFARVVWDLYRHTVPPRAPFARTFARQFMFALGAARGAQTFFVRGKPRRAMSYLKT